LQIDKLNKAGLVAAIIHLVCVIGLGIFILLKGGDYTYFWMVFVILDFPISLGMYVFSFIRLDYQTVNSIDSFFYWGAFNDFKDVLLPMFYLGALGSYWWYKIVSWISGKRKS